MEESARIIWGKRLKEEKEVRRGIRLLNAKRRENKNAKEKKIIKWEEGS